MEPEDEIKVNEAEQSPAKREDGVVRVVIVIIVVVVTRCFRRFCSCNENNDNMSEANGEP
jgi:hypothetical protein